MKEKVSVIIPIYKVEKYLDECIRSVVKQSHTNLEIILVDDGSPDACPAMCDKWADKDDRIQVIHKENGGLSDARNAGMKTMTGDYVLFVDSDDYLANNMVEELLEKANQYSCDIVMCNKTVVTKTNQKKELDDESVQVFEGDDIVENYLYQRNDFCSGIWNKLIKMEIIKDLEFPKGINSEDYYMYSFIYYRAKKMIKYNKCLYYYRIRKGSICKSGVNDQTFAKIKVAKLAEKNLLDQGYTNLQAIKHFRMHSYHDVLNYLLRFDDTEAKYINKTKKGLRKYYWNTIRDSKNSIGMRIKFTMLCTAPKLYTKAKKKILKQSYLNDPKEWFD